LLSCYLSFRLYGDYFLISICGAKLVPMLRIIGRLNMQLNFKIAFLAAWTLAVLTIPFSESKVVKGRRNAYGSERATTVEKLPQKLYPGTTVQWDPHLAIRDVSGKLEPVELGDLSSMRQSDGSMISVTHLQVGTGKRDYIENEKQFRPVASTSI
jgi:hypothetical protein